MTATRKILSLLMFLLMLQLSAVSVYCDTENGNDNFMIRQTEDIVLGEIIPGTTRTEFYEGQTVKFEVKSNHDQTVRIIKINGLTDPDISYTAEWKIGPDTGFEQILTDGGVYQIEAKKRVYITITIKSLTATVNAAGGSHRFSPGFTVEFIEA